MHRYNNKYGYGAILRSYCGVSPEQPIMGEVQHSLFVSTHHFSSSGIIGPPRSSGRGLLTLFSWQTLLPFANQVPIGDPVFYDPVMNGQTAPIPQHRMAGEDYVLVMPKLNEELAEEERIRDYRRLLDFATDLQDNRRLVLSLHPRDAHLYAVLGEHHASQLPPSKARESSALAVTRAGLELVRHASLVVSDYFGAHVFRASGLYGLPAMVVGDSALHRAIHPTMRAKFQDFLEAQTPHSSPKNLSREILGWTYQREVQELREILFPRRFGSLSSRFVVSGYKSLRRVRVQLRNSPLWGRSAFARWWWRNISLPKWNAQFPPLDTTRAAPSGR